MMMTVEMLIEQLRKNYRPDEYVIYTLWSKEDYPETWDQIAERYHHRSGYYLVDVQRPILDDLAREDDEH